MFARSFVRTPLLSVTTAAILSWTAGPLTARAAEEKDQAAKHQEHMAKMPSSMAQVMKMDPAECFKVMDKEHKGHVTKKEFMQFQEDLWNRMDKDRSGKVTLPEFTDRG